MRPSLLSQETVPGILAFEQGLMESLVFTVNLWGVMVGVGGLPLACLFEFDLRGNSLRRRTLERTFKELKKNKFT